MGYRFRVHHDLRLVYKKVWGHYGDPESVASHVEWDAMCAESPPVGEYNEFHDLIQVSRYDVSIDQIRRLANQHEAEWETGLHQPKSLAYVAPTPLAFGTGRVYGSLMATTGVSFRVFTSLDEACEWLGIAGSARSRVIEIV